MENGNAKERRIAQELELLKQYQRVSVKDLAATLEVSEMTIRRDLDPAEKPCIGTELWLCDSRQRRRWLCL